MREIASALNLPGLRKHFEMAYLVHLDGQVRRAFAVVFRNDVARDSPEAQRLERHLHTRFLKVLIRDLVELEGGRGISDLSLVRGVVAANPYYDDRIYQRPERITEELLNLGALTPAALADGGEVFLVPRDLPLVVAALSDESPPGS